MKDRKLLNIELGRVRPSDYASLPPSGAVLVLDNIRSAHNVGSAFRTADAFKADKVWLCGICACPPSAEIHKSALGAENSVPWEHADDTLELVKRLREDGYIIISVEQTEHAPAASGPERLRRCPVCVRIRERGRRGAAGCRRRLGLLAGDTAVRHQAFA